MKKKISALTEITEIKHTVLEASTSRVLTCNSGGTNTSPVDPVLEEDPNGSEFPNGSAVGLAAAAGLAANGCCCCWEL